MLTDQQDKQLEQKQTYQWIAFKALVIDQDKVLQGYPVAIAQTGRQNNIVLLFVLAKVLNKEKIQSKNEELSEINFYSKDQVREFLDQRFIRPVMVELLERFVKGGFNG